MNAWLIMVGAGVITFGLRFSFFYLYGKADFPVWFRRSLHYVPAAVLAAIVLPGLAIRNDAINFTDNPRLLAGIIAAIVAWRTGSALATMIVGMASLWLIQFWL